MTTKPQTPKARRTIAINSDYRLAFDADNVIIERLTTVDPTRSPNFKAGDDVAIRTEWRSTGKYYATIPKALTALLEYSIRTGEAATLREVLVQIDEFRTHINGLLGSDI